MKPFSLILFVLLISQFRLSAQQKDSIQVDSTSASKITPATFPDSIFKFRVNYASPKRAGLYSALLPGLGQSYNKQYWKTGLAYVGVGVIAYFIIDNHNNFQRYQKAYVARLNNANDLSQFPELNIDNLKYLRDNYARFKEYSVIAAVVGYFINIIDAFTAAHLKTFDMSKDISFHIAPNMNMQTSASLKITIPLH